MRTFTFHTDSGHGWLEVPKAIVHSLDISISPYSYHDSKNYYLEEDLDAGVFLKAYKAQGSEYKIKEKHTNRSHYIRNKDRVRDPNYVSPFMK
jgi:hypothetical protein